MKGLNIKRNILDIKEKNDYSLLAEHNNVQLIVQHIKKNNKIYIAPALNNNVFEFFYIASGKIEFKNEDKIVTLSTGDCFYYKDPSEITFIHVCEDTTALYFTTEPVFDDLSEMNNEVNEIISEIDRKDRYTKGHCNRVGMYTAALAQRCTEKIPSMINLMYASKLHDIGKCMISDEILLKPGKFNEEESDIMNNHPSYSYKMLREKFNLDPSICKIAECHHERYDGSGYPNGLKGEEIPIESRIITIVDTFDAITSNRSYQLARSPEEAINEMEAVSHHFDPNLFEIFKELVKDKIIHPSIIPDDFKE